MDKNPLAVPGVRGSMERQGGRPTRGRNGIVQRDIGWIGRRDLARLLGAGTGAAALLGALPARVHAQTRRETLVIGIDISDTITFDPAREAQYTAPMTLQAAYDALLAVSPDDYNTPRPALATAWARTPDGKGWRFTLRPDVRFASGNTMTADDVKWSFDRTINLKDQPSQYIWNIAAVNVIDPATVDILLHQPDEPILSILASTNFAVMDRRTVEAQGGTAAADASTADTATPWLNQHSAGTGAYVLVGWVRNAQIQLRRNPHDWRGGGGFARIVIRHLSDSAAQLLAIRRGDVDVACNLIPEQVASLRAEPATRVERLTSLDFVYMALTENAAFSKPLAVKAARQAIGFAIDYDGIRDNLLGGAAVRPASFLPIGVRGSTEPIARDIGFRQDLDRARHLLRQAGMPDGFEFAVGYGDAAVSGLSYALLAQKLQSDLARVGIRMTLAPMDQVNLRTQYTTGKSVAVLTFWNPPNTPEEELWAGASVERVAKRLHWTPPEALVRLVHQAASESDPAQQEKLWIDYQTAMVEEANLIVLFQPVYQFAVRSTVKLLPLTAAGPQAELSGAQPA